MLLTDRDVGDCGENVTDLSALSDMQLNSMQRRFVKFDCLVAGLVLEQSSGWLCGGGGARPCTPPLPGNNNHNSQVPGGFTITTVKVRSAHHLADINNRAKREVLPRDDRGVRIS